jgi:hypothetical protein
MRISGAFIGVVIPEGTPKILNVSTRPFNSGDSGTIVVMVKNVGNSQGSFYTSLSNCNGIQSSISSNYAFSVGQVQNLNISIYTSGTNSNLTEQCTVTVTDANGGGVSSMPVTVIMKQANQCTPNQQILQGSSICSCTNVNGVYQPTACNACPNGVTNTNGQFVCAPAPKGTNSSSSSGVNVNIGSASGLIGGTVQVVVGVSGFVSCTPGVGAFLNTIVPWATTAANFVNSFVGNSCG